MVLHVTNKDTKAQRFSSEWLVLGLSSNFGATGWQNITSSQKTQPLPEAQWRGCSVPRGQGQSRHHGGLRQVSELAISQSPGLVGKSALGPVEKAPWEAWWQGHVELAGGREGQGRDKVWCWPGETCQNKYTTTGKIGENRHVLVQWHTSCGVSYSPCHFYKTHWVYLTYHPGIFIRVTIHGEIQALLPLYRVSEIGYYVVKNAFKWLPDTILPGA